MPGTLVGTDLNSPRIWTGASGFMSQRSIWLGPPNRKMNTQHFLRRPAIWDGAARDRNRVNSGTVKPSSPSDPTRNSSRRVSRSDGDGAWNTENINCSAECGTAHPAYFFSSFDSLFASTAALTSTTVV